jgi:hypothetical protein
VNALAHRLNRDRFWDKKQVNAIIKEFKLKQVPSAQKPKP